VFRNVGNYKSDAGESPKRRHTITSVRLHYLIAEKFCLLRNTATYNMGEIMLF
jgi:hypothetical protein